MKRSPSRILVLGRPGKAPHGVVKGLHAQATVDVCEQVREAVERLSTAFRGLEGYDAVLCQADQPEDLSVVVRLRKRDPEAPILLISGRAEHPDFRELAFRLGATSILPSAASRKDVRAALLRAAEARRAAGVLLSTIRGIRTLARDVRVLASNQKALAARSLGLAREGQA